MERGLGDVEALSWVQEKKYTMIFEFFAYIISTYFVLSLISWNLYMNRDATIVQVAILLIIIAIIGVAILQQQRKPLPGDEANTKITAIQEADNDNMWDSVDEGNTTGEVATPPSKIVELENSARRNLVKQYFAYVANRDYKGACSVMSLAKCNASKPAAVAGFSREFEKFANGYEYVNIKDYGFIAPSGKQIVCVKYSYRYKDDPNPGLVSEVLSFYLNDVWGETKIVNRVCEKKYKDGRGLRDCPIEAAAEFCEGRVK